MIQHRKLVIILVASMVLAPFIFFSSNPAPWQTGALVNLFGQETINAIGSVWYGSKRFAQTVWSKYIYLVDVADQNSELKSQLAMLQARIMDYEDQVDENNRLRKLLGFAGSYDRKLVAAEVISQVRHYPFHSVRISRGSSVGVKVGMPVVAADGVVGRVIRTGKAFSDVQLLVDANFNLDVLLQRNRVRGVLSGAAGQSCKLNLHRRAEIKVGDTIITSGIVGGFPKGLPVGKVVKISYGADDIAQTIVVEPWVNPWRLEEVMVLFNIDSDLQKISESAGPTWIDSAVGRAIGRKGG